MDSLGVNIAFLGLLLTFVVVFTGSHFYRLTHYPAREISYWLEDGCIVVRNTSREAIFDVIPYVASRGGTRKVFRYMPSHITPEDAAADLTYEDRERVTFHAISLPPGMWAVQLGSEVPDPRDLGLAFENARGLLFQLEYGAVRRRVSRSGARWLGTQLPDHTELEFTRIDEQELGAPFQRPAPEASVMILSSSAEAKAATAQPVRS